MKEVVVVGAGQAGASCVARLRRQGFEGGITLIGEEPVIPYQRPPLSKAYLLGEMSLDRLYLKPESYYAENDIELRTGTAVTGINLGAQQVKLAGESLRYDALVLATGSAPIRLPAAMGGDLEGVFTVRDLSDVDRMAPWFEAGKKVLIVGGGYIGLEAAAVAAKKELDVTLVEMAPRILQRVAAPETSDYFRDLHARHGVRILEETGLERLEGQGRVTYAVLTDGTRLEVDFVIVGVGIRPATALAEAAAIEVVDGIAVDAQGRTSAPGVWAAGDCASFLYQGNRIRLESVPHAIDQAELVADNIMGAAQDYVARPWFWSDQYDVKLQIAGLNRGYTDVVTRRGAKGAVSFWYFNADKLLAVDALNDPRSYMIGKRLVEAGKSPPAEGVADAESDLKAFLKA